MTHSNEAIKMEIKNVLMEKKAKEAFMNNESEPSFLGDQKYESRPTDSGLLNHDKETTIRCGWRMVAYLRKEAIDSVAQQLQIDVKTFTEADYNRIAIHFFSKFLTSERLKAATDFSVEAAIKLHMSEKESPNIN
ncbi:MAG: hypothetical protein WCH07_11265, partial [Deltaproteobacteria bacterium]